MKKKIRIGLLINTIYSDYATEFTNGLRMFCEENNYELIIFPVLKGVASSRFDFQYDTNLHFINKQNIDVLILSSSSLSNYLSKEEYVKTLKSFSVPMISAGLVIEGIPSIVLSSKKSIVNLITHIVQKHKRKKFLLARANSKSPESLEREEAFKEALKLNGLKFDEKKAINANFVYEGAKIMLLQYLKKLNNKPDFDAIFCCNDATAFGCIAALQEVNIDVPKKVSVAGFDKVDFTDSNGMKLATIDQHCEKQGRKSGELAVELLRKRKIPLVTKFTATSVYQESCGCNEPCSCAKHNKKTLYKKDKELDLIHFFLTESQEPLSLARIGGRLEYSFSLFDIANAFVVFYEKPIINTENIKFELPKKARLEFSYSQKTGIKNPETIFNPTEHIIPLEEQKLISKPQIIFPLNSGNTLYGYMIFALGKYKILFYQDMFEMISKEIISAIKVLKIERQAEELKKRNITLSSYSEELFTLSRKDELTGLLNRRGFFQEAENAIRNTAANNKTGIVIFADMDGLKVINDTFGHDAGDRAIKAASQVLQKTFKSSNIIGRLGGDEFGVVALDISKKEFSAIKKRIKQRCENFNASSGEKFILSISAGCTEFSSTKNNLEELLLASDKLLYAEKKRKKVERK